MRGDFMNNYLVPILYGIVIFPIISLIFTLPYMIFQYRKYGSIPSIRVLIVYSFILYLICAYFLVILPLPSIESVANLKIARYQIIPFNLLSDFIKNTSFSITDASTYLAVIKNPIFYQTVYNVLLFLPFGVYLKYYFKCSLTKTIIYSFLLSLFFELTQLTGLYFIYPRNYRLFDVDDLIVNTIGGITGYYFSFLISKIFPSRDEIDKRAYLDGDTIPLFRRVFAFILDYFIVNVFAFLSFSFVRIFVNIDNIIIYYVCLILYYIIFTYVSNGYTLGKKFFKIKIVSLEGKLKIEQIIVRYGLLYFLAFKIPKLLLKYFNYNFLIKIIKTKNELIYLFFSVIIFVLIIYIIKRLNDISHGKLLLYEKLSKTKNINMIDSSKEKVIKYYIRDN